MENDPFECFDERGVGNMIKDSIDKFRENNSSIRTALLTEYKHADLRH